MAKGVRNRPWKKNQVPLYIQRIVGNVQRYADNLQFNTQAIKIDAALAIATAVVNHTPVWSGQARLNWTASLDTKMPPRRFVNVPRKNSRLRHAKKGESFGSLGGTKITTRAGTGTHGGFKDIRVDPIIAGSAHTVSLASISSVFMAQRYTQPPRGGRRPIATLSNSLPYIGKLWSGSWKSNPRTLESQLDYGIRVIREREGRILSNGN